ncbi:MAG: Crp/Fnr family transcriptional regulator [Gemmatimonadota bacterium]
MDPDQAIPLLERCPPLAPLSRASKLSLAEVCREVRFEADERIFSIAKPIRRILILLEGRAKLVGVTEQGVERILYVYQPCEIIGSRILLDESVESPFEVIAMEDILVLAFTKADFRAVAIDHPEVLESITSVLLERVETLATWMLAAMSVDASMRLAKLLLNFADEEHASEEFVPLKYSPTHETMAQIIGATRPHTTTLLRDLEAKGAIRRLRPRGVLVSPPRLRKLLKECGIRPVHEAG